MSSSSSDAAVHRLTNQLSIVLGFCELVLTEMDEDDRHRPDILQIQQAGRTALAILRDQAVTVNQGPLGEPNEE